MPPSLINFGNPCPSHIPRPCHLPLHLKYPHPSSPSLSHLQSLPFPILSSSHPFIFILTHPLSTLLLFSPSSSCSYFTCYSFLRSPLALFYLRIHLGYPHLSLIITKITLRNGKWSELVHFRQDKTKKVECSFAIITLILLSFPQSQPLPILVFHFGNSSDMSFCKHDSGNFRHEEMAGRGKTFSLFRINVFKSQ